jgi:hypothetical protein
MRKFIVVLLLTGLVWPYGAIAQSPIVAAKNSRNPRAA